MTKLVLASASERRKNLLQKAGYSFTVYPSHVSENIEKNLTPDLVVLQLSERKARACCEHLEAEILQDFSTIVLAADTDVFLKHERLEKPENADVARHHLGLLSGQKHEVWTGVTMIHPSTGTLWKRADCTKVEFKKLTAEEIEDYIFSKEWVGKAGSYGIQGLAQTFVVKLEGDLENVIGLSTRTVEVGLREINLRAVQNVTGANCKLLAVSKLQTVEKIRELHSLGQFAFGENYVQEALSKQEELSDLPIEWHFIGQLQRKKVNSVVGRFALIHSVGSKELLEKISAAAVTKNVEQKILLQVNIADEDSKNGFLPSEVRELFAKNPKWPNLVICGLMTLPPLGSKDGNRQYFEQLRGLRDELQKTFPELVELSMGTSHDFQMAVNCGATWVRVGTVLFGEREQK